jgi:hypothetical protein
MPYASRKRPFPYDRSDNSSGSDSSGSETVPEPAQKKRRVPTKHEKPRPDTSDDDEVEDDVTKAIERLSKHLALGNQAIGNATYLLKGFLSDLKEQQKL